MYFFMPAGLIQQWKAKRREQKTKRTVARLKSEVHKWSPTNMAEIIRICARSKVLDRPTLLKCIGVKQGDISSSPSPMVPKRNNRGIYADTRFSNGHKITSNDQKGLLNNSYISNDISHTDYHVYQELTVEDSNSLTVSTICDIKGD